MSERSAESASIHNRLIMAMVKLLMSKDYEVFADHIGYPNGKPQPWKGYIPDVFAEKGNEKIYVEAETDDSIDDVDTKLQWIALSSNPAVKFQVIVPSKTLPKAKANARDWGVDVDAFWSMDI